ncbi:CPBP family intramembrane glutamic endopeptidase [Brevundimonas variabilis]|uniref:Membrane protease YdiL (CAAX protease family) n=1 Tax=Brevundimonas variabilis TaxID=74312 RepID=A0A7W9FHF7_9CAUL|nr:CPBP family intramembrane glutamic endopeptidase [Brevundimonas variabilis]MBB5747404.1 membrane protease YdiL (CAAX protease family) [Brevundimonas variabilis]
MKTTSAYGALTWLCVAGITALLGWLALTLTAYPATPYLALAMIGVSWAFLKLGSSDRTYHWTTVSEPRQVPRVVALIVLVSVIQIAVSVLVRTFAEMTVVWASVIYIVVWTAVPVAMIGFGVVRLPRRQSSPAKRDFIIVASAATLFAALDCWVGMVTYNGERAVPSFFELALGGSYTLLGATMEEVIYRVLLITALFKVTGSRTQSLVISSVAFGLAHLPAFLYAPILAQDWTQVAIYLKDDLAALSFIIGFGFIAGSVWLRTGSVALIILMHTLSNLADVLVGGLNGI